MTQKLWEIKPHLWPRTEFLLSGGQESRRLSWFSNNISETHSSILAWRIPMDRGAWQATVHRVTKSHTWWKWLSMHTYRWEACHPITISYSDISITSYCRKSYKLERHFAKYWKVVVEVWKTPGFLASGEEFNPGLRLDLSELLCHKVLLKYKRERDSFWHRHQKGAERVPPC